MSIAKIIICHGQSVQTLMSSHQTASYARLSFFLAVIILGSLGIDDTAQKWYAILISDHRSPMTDNLIPHPSSLIPHPSSLIPHPSPFIPHPSSLIPHPSSLTLHPSSLIPHPLLLIPYSSWYQRVDVM
jgi:hypothetical protein